MERPNLHLSKKRWKDLIYETIKDIERREDRSLFQLVTFSEIYEGLKNKPLPSKRTLLRYLSNLRYEKRIFRYKGNTRARYMSDIMNDLKIFLEEMRKSRLISHLDFNSKVIEKIMTIGSTVKPEWKDADTINLLRQIEEWFSKHLTVYISGISEVKDSSKSNVRKELDQTVMSDIIGLVYSISLMYLKIGPLFADKGFQVLINFQPEPFSLAKY